MQLYLGVSLEASVAPCQLGDLNGLEERFQSSHISHLRQLVQVLLTAFPWARGLLRDSNDKKDLVAQLVKWLVVLFLTPMTNLCSFFKASNSDAFVLKSSFL